MNRKPRRAPGSNQGRPPVAFKAVVDAMRQWAASTVDDLARDAGVSTRTVRRYLVKLDKAGHLIVLKPEHAHDPLEYKIKDPS